MADVLPPPPVDIKEARRLYVERAAGIYTTNNFLKVFAGSLVLLCILLGAGWYHAEQRSSHVKPFVVSVEHGEPTVVPDEKLIYKPTEQVLKHFLLTFTTLYYTRLRATVQRDFERSLYFLDGPLADSVLDLVRKTKSIETFLTDGSEEIEIKVSNVDIEETPGPVYRGVVDYERIYRRERREVRRERYLGRYTFVMKEIVPIRLVPVNPLGLTILSLSDNRVFEEER